MMNSLTTKHQLIEKAFLWSTVVNYKLGIPEYITRIAWSELTEQQKN